MTVSGLERSVASGACADDDAASPAIHRAHATARNIDIIGGLLIRAENPAHLRALFVSIHARFTDPGWERSGHPGPPSRGSLDRSTRATNSTLRAHARSSTARGRSTH